jgi:hypothetical protein
MASRNRTAGHNFERKIAEQLRDLGYPHVVTSRSESRSRDDQKIDLINKDEAINGRLPYNIQCKNSVRSLKYPKVLSEIPYVPGVINLIIHRQTEKSENGRFITRDDYAILKWGDFRNIIKKLKQYEGVQV